MGRRHALLASLLGIGLFLSRGLLRGLLDLSRGDDSFSHLPLIPVLSLYLLYSRRKEIFRNPRYAALPGAAIAAAGTLLQWAPAAFPGRLAGIPALSVGALGLLLAAAGLLLALYGAATVRAAAFPLLFLLFAVPLPGILLDPVVTFLQEGSTEVVDLLFSLAGTPHYRTAGTVFRLPGLDIEVARECSGIRSTLSLVVVSVLMGHLFLRSPARKLLLALSVVPITLLKNGIRIVALSLLTIHVDPGFMTGNLHQWGGIPFFAGSVLLLGGVLWILRRSDTPASAARPPEGS